MTLRPLVLAEMAKSGRFPQLRALEITPIVIDDVIAYHDALYESNPAALDKIWRESRIRPPFETTWLEACSSRQWVGHEAYIAADITCGPAEPLTRAFLMMARERGAERDPGAGPPQGFGVNAMWVNVTCWENGANPTWNGSWIVQLDEDGKSLPGDFLIATAVPSDREISRGRELDVMEVLGNKQSMQGHAARVGWIQVWIGIFHHALALMHVKNAEYVAYGGRTQRRYVDRVAKGVVVKELVIAPLRRTVKMIRQHQQAHPGEPLPLHWCRGHFKTFTPHRPLFGSITGTFWWEPHLRGSEHMGVVVHDRGRIVLPQVAQPQRTP